MCHKRILSGLQSDIKMIHLIILAAVIKGYKWSPHQQDPHMRFSLLARTTFCLHDVMMQCHAWISHENLPVLLKLENIIS